MVLYRGCTVCVVEGWSIVEVIKVNVANIKAAGGGAGGGVRKQTAGEEWEEGGGETALPLKYKKWNLKDQTVTNDTALLGTMYMNVTLKLFFSLPYSLSPSLPLSPSLTPSFSLSLSLPQLTPPPLPLTISVRPVTWLVSMPPFALPLCRRLSSSRWEKTP